MKPSPRRPCEYMAHSSERTDAGSIKTQLCWDRMEGGCTVGHVTSTSVGIASLGTEGLTLTDLCASALCLLLSELTPAWPSISRGYFTFQPSLVSRDSTSSVKTSRKKCSQNRVDQCFSTCVWVMTPLWITSAIYLTVHSVVKKFVIK